MLFAPVASLLALVAVASAEANVSVVQDSLNDLSGQCSNIIPKVNGLVFNRKMALDIGEIHTGIYNLAQSTGQHAKTIAGTAASYDEENQKAICSAYQDFTRTEKSLLDKVSDKLRFIRKYYPPRGFEDIFHNLHRVDQRLSSAVLDTIPSCISDAQKDNEMLDMALLNAVQQANATQHWTGHP